MAEKIEVGDVVLARGATGQFHAVVAGIRLGRLDSRVDVQTRGGELTIEWAGPAAVGVAPVLMTGPAVTVFEGEIEIPE